MRKKAFYYLFYLTLVSLFTFSSCKSGEYNYITYYNKVNKIDSIYRFQKDTLSVIKQYNKLFRQYPPKNQERIEEYATYIKLSDKFNKNFGGKKSLYKLIPLIAPFNKEYKKYYWLYQKYGIDSIEVKQEIAQWKKGLNKKMMDSFTILFIRDQEKDRSDSDLVKINDKKNAELFKWILENEGYPSVQKIGLWGNKGVFMPMSAFLSHMSFSDSYPYFEKKLLEYVKTGDCPPHDYANMVDRHYLQVLKKDILYGVYIGHNNIQDSIKINSNRKSIGLPSLKHTRAITIDFFKQLKK